MEYFEKELEDAKREVAVKGATIEKLASSLPAYVETRYSQLQEIEAILEYLNINYRKVRAAAFKGFLENYNKALTPRDAEKYADGDPSVVAAAMLVNEIALLRNKYIAIHKGMDVKNWQLSNIVKLRCAGLDDARID